MKSYYSEELSARVCYEEEAQAEIDELHKKLTRCQKRNHQKNVDNTELVDMLVMLMSSGLMENETQGYTYCEVTEDEYRESLRLIAKHKGE